MAIDMHCHFVPPDLVEALRARTDPPRLECDADGVDYIVQPVGRRAFTAANTDMEARLVLMDRLGVETEMLSLGLLMGVHSLPLPEAGPLVQMFNDALSVLCRRFPDRFVGLAALPMADLPAAVAELRRARRDLGLVGAILPANCLVSLAEADKLRPIFAAGQELGLHFFVHPGRRTDENSSIAAPFADNLLHRHTTLAVQHALSMALVTLALGDYLDSYPNVTFQVANLGGSIPFVIDRMDRVAHMRKPGSPAPSERIRRVFVDCATMGAAAIEMAIRVFGEQQVLLGTDCPIFPMEWSVAAASEADLSPKQRQMLLHDNAARLHEGLAARMRTSN